MRSAQWLAILTLAMGTAAAGAEGLDISGYYEHQFFPQEIGDELALQDYDRLRLDLRADVDERIGFAGDIVYRLFHGDTDFELFEVLPRRIVEDYATAVGTPEEALAPQFRLEMEDEQFLNEAYVTFYGEGFDLRIGRQPIPWGAGYTWNPTDLFNAKDLLDPTYEKRGVDAFRLDVPFGVAGMLTGIFGAGEDWGSSTRAFRAKGHLRGFDFSVSAAETMEKRIDYLAAAGSVAERRRMLGGDFSGGLLGLGVWGEGAFNWMEGDDDFGQYLLGADYTFENGLYLTGEYYRNGLGKGDEAEYDFADWMRMLGGEGENLGRDYLFCGQSYPVGELWDWSNFLIANLDDRSVFFFPWLDYSMGDNTEVDLVGYVPVGDGDTEFGAFGPGGFARVRVYF